MIFIIEKAINDFRAKQEAWEHARDKWMNEDTGSYNYRSERDYERNHPRPTNWLPIIVRSVAIGVCIALAVILFVGFAKEVIADSKNKPKEAVVKSDKNCQAFNKNDHVRIQYGDYIGNNGTIVGGCGDNEHYQVKLDPNQKANVSNDGNGDPVDVGGNVISVDSNKNLVKIEVPEEKKE